MRVDRARARDAVALLALERQVLEEGAYFVRMPHEAHSLKRIDALIVDFSKSDNSAWLVAREGAAILGFVRVSGGSLVRTRHSAKLEIMVSASARGKGVGRALMSAALEWARGNDLVTRVALAVFADNAAALRLYADLGFVEEGRRVGEYREADGRLRDDVLMALAI